MAPLDDPDAAQQSVTALVRALHGRCQAEADERQAQLRAKANGHRPAS
jgi:hypothetical protein